MPIFLEFYAVAVRQASVREHISEMYEQFSIPLTKLIEEDVAHPAIFLPHSCRFYRVPGAISFGYRRRVPHDAFAAHTEDHDGEGKFTLLDPDVMLPADEPMAKVAQSRDLVFHLMIHCKALSIVVCAPPPGYDQATWL